MLRMLMFDPRKRIGVEEALRHPWLAQLHDETQEPSAPGGPCAAAVRLHAGSRPAVTCCAGAVQPAQHPLTTQGGQAAVP
jgi:hypothetical protein